MRQTAYRTKQYSAMKS